jgi:hypothetical protein
LQWVQEPQAEGKVVNEIKVDPFTKYWARVSLQRMLDITAGVPVSAPPGTPPVKEEARGGGLRVLTH